MLDHDTSPKRPARASRVSDAYTRLKDDILHNRLPAGFQAPEPEIAARLGMSRTPVREALIRLQAEGLVELIPRRGARILPVVAADMQEIYEILTALEPSAAADLAARRPSDQDLTPLAQATEDMEHALDQGDLEGWAVADDRFHRTLLDLHGNQRLCAIAASLFDQAHRARMVTLRLRQPPAQSTAEHREILTHLAKGDADAVRAAFTRHRQRAAAELLGILDSYGLPPL